MTVLPPAPWHRNARPPALMLFCVAALHLRVFFHRSSFLELWSFSFDAYLGATNLLQVKELFSTGIIPLWTTHNVMGCPLIGLYLSTLVNPLVQATLHFSFGDSFALLAALHSLLVAFFGCLLFRRSRASVWASSATGFLLAMTGFIPWITPLYPVIAPMPWLLCWLWSAMGIMERPILRRWLVNLVSVTLLLGGDAQIAIEGAYFVGAWVLIYGHLSDRKPAEIVRSFMLLFIAAAAGYLLASAQMVPATLYFQRAVSVRTPAFSEYAATYPALPAIVPAGLGLFTRMFRVLFLPFSVLLLMAAAFRQRPRNPAFSASLILAAAILVMVLFAHSGLAALPFHLPLLKSFVRHYKWAVILQGPLFIGVALGFDALHDLLRARGNRWAIAAAVTLVLTLVVVPGVIFKIAVATIASIYCFFLKRENAIKALPPLLFALLVTDAASSLWKLPYTIDLPDPDPVYPERVAELGGDGRVQGMYPWMVRAGREINRPIPVHGTGFFNDYSIDSWLEFPIKSHAYFLAAICPEVSRIEGGEFSQVDFITCFKSTDWVNPRNRHLVNLAALRLFFLQDMALSEADRFPILLDPANYLAPGGLEKLFAPWKALRRDVQLGDGDASQDLPVLQSNGPGAYAYRRAFQTGDRFEARVMPGRASDMPVWTAAIATADGRSALAYCRALTTAPAASAPVSIPLPGGTDGALSFSLLPGGTAEVTWVNPTIVNPAKTIKFVEGDRVMVFENTEALARARIVHRALAASSVEAAFEIARSPETFEPRVETILIGTNDKPQDGPPPSPDETAAVSADNTSKLTVTARLDRPGWLAVSDTYYPGWRAFDDQGRELRILPADISLRAVQLPAGDHRLTFLYLPLDFEIGLWVSLGGLASLLVVLASRLRRTPGQEIASPAPPD